jgi:hypothetical protein
MGERFRGMHLLAPLVCIQYGKNRLGSGKGLGGVSWYQETVEYQLEKCFDFVPTSIVAHLGVL